MPRAARESTSDDVVHVLDIEEILELRYDTDWVENCKLHFYIENLRGVP